MREITILDCVCIHYSVWISIQSSKDLNFSGRSNISTWYYIGCMMHIVAHLYNNPLYENKSMSETIVHITNCMATFMGCINVFTKQFLSTIIVSMCFWGLNCIRHPPRHIVLDFYTTPQYIVNGYWPGGCNLSWPEYTLTL